MGRWAGRRTPDSAELRRMEEKEVIARLSEEDRKKSEVRMRIQK
jgi:hypothetical protein